MRPGAALLLCALALGGGARGAAATAGGIPPRSPAAPETPLSVESLLARFRALPSLEARFREEKKLALLVAPLVSEGTVAFLAPDRLARRTERPSPSTLLVDSRSLRFSDGGTSQAIPLEGNPAVQMFVDVFVKVLAGDKPGLERILEIDLRPLQAAAPPGPLPCPRGESPWAMTLKPKLAPMTQLVEKFVINGCGLVLSSLLVREVGGDETKTTFTAVDLGRRFTPAEVERVFAIPGPAAPGAPKR